MPMERCPLPDDEITLPVPGHGAVFDLGGALGDHDHVVDGPLAARLAGSLRTAQGPALAQAAVQLLAQRPPALDEERHIDGLVAHTHLRVLGIRPGQPVGDLLW